jgi:vitamin B12 transporter
MGRAQNLGKTLSQGLELSARKTWEKGDLRSSVTRLFVARNELTGAELPQRPKLQATIGAGFRVTEGARVDAQFRFHGGRRNSFPDVALPSYSVLDLSGRFQFTRSIGIQAKLENLFDRNYQEVAGYNTPGRSLSIGVEGVF